MLLIYVTFCDKHASSILTYCASELFGFKNHTSINAQLQLLRLLQHQFHWEHVQMFWMSVCHPEIKKLEHKLVVSKCVQTFFR